MIEPLGNLLDSKRLKKRDFLEDENILCLLQLTLLLNHSISNIVPGSI